MDIEEISRRRGEEKIDETKDMGEQTDVNEFVDYEESSSTSVYSYSESNNRNCQGSTYA